jgi:hypothetical protein
MIKNKWKNSDIKKYIPEFYELYGNKPLKTNDGGMKFPHMFLAWYLIKKIKPKFLIESGVWRGLGTWFIEQASPNTKIFSIDPHPEYRIYTSNRVQYYTADYSELSFNVDPDETLVFFDDHQNVLSRIQQSVSKGFKKLIFEDNYPHMQGDCYSIKKILSGEDFVIDIAGNRTFYQARLQDKKYLEDIITVYQEMPPTYIGEKTRWNTDWNLYDTPKCLLSHDEMMKYPDILSEMNDYTWLCYVELQ